MAADLRLLIRGWGEHGTVMLVWVVWRWEDGGKWAGGWGWLEWSRTSVIRRALPFAPHVPPSDEAILMWWEHGVFGKNMFENKSCIAQHIIILSTQNCRATGKSKHIPRICYMLWWHFMGWGNEKKCVFTESRKLFITLSIIILPLRQCIGAL